MDNYDDYRLTQTMAEDQRLRELQEMGFFAGYALDIRVGDIIEKTPDTLFRNWPMGKMVVVIRVLTTDASYYNEETDGVVQHQVICFIGEDEDGLQRDYSYGNTHAFHIYRPVV